MMCVADVPQFVTHYHHADRQPFLNLSDLQPDQLESVLRELDGLAQSGRSARRFGSRYMQLRRQTEALLRERFVARGGRPVRRSPHYFVLGESSWFRGLYPDCAEVRLRLDELPADATSITWPDSVVSMGLLSGYGIAVDPKPQYDKVYLLDELAEVIDRYGLPASDPTIDYDGYQRAAEDHFVEVQVWTDDLPVVRAQRL